MRGSGKVFEGREEHEDDLRLGLVRVPGESGVQASNDGVGGRLLGWWSPLLTQGGGAQWEVLLRASSPAMSLPITPSALLP